MPALLPGFQPLPKKSKPGVYPLQFHPSRISLSEVNPTEIWDYLSLSFLPPSDNTLGFIGFYNAPYEPIGGREAYPELEAIPMETTQAYFELLEWIEFKRSWDQKVFYGEVSMDTMRLMNSLIKV